MTGQPRIEEFGQIASTFVSVCRGRRSSVFDTGPLGDGGAGMNLQVLALDNERFVAEFKDGVEHDRFRSRIDPEDCFDAIV